jgi:hypothetical protein
MSGLSASRDVSFMTQRLHCLRLSGKVVLLTQKHFTNGTVLIQKDSIVWTNPETSMTVTEVRPTTGIVLKLAENIDFNPNAIGLNGDSLEAGRVRQSQFGHYNPQSFGIGFFAAIVLASENVVLDLNGFTLSQSVEHNIQQRFFSLIELAPTPFVRGQGPHDFGPLGICAKSVMICNGTIGRSSHHGIHGNDCSDVFIKNVKFEGYEVAAVSLNGARRVCIEDVTLSGNSQAVPVLGSFSAARFLWPYITKIPDEATVQLRSLTYTAKVIRESLHAKMKESFDAIVYKKGDIPHPFKNESGLLDGTSYGIVFNGLGVAVNGFPTDVGANPSRSIFLNRVTVCDTISAPREVLALERESGSPGLPETDPVGSVLRINEVIDSTGHYIGDVLSDAQCLVATYKLQGFDFKNLDATRSSIGEMTLKVAADKTKTFAGRPYVFNGDSMHHAMKGVIAFKLDQCKNLECVDCVSTNTKNLNTIYAHTYASVKYDNFESLSQTAQNAYLLYSQRLGLSNVTSTTFGNLGSESRGLSLSSSQRCSFYNFQVLNVSSILGRSLGVHMQHACEHVSFKKSVVGVVSASTEALEIQLALHPSMRSDGRGFSAPPASCISQIQVLGPVSSKTESSEIIMEGIAPLHTPLRTPKRMRFGNRFC